MALQTLVPEMLWHAQQPIRFGPLDISTRMTVVKLDDGTLWVHSPILPTAALCEALDALGPVAAIVAPNASHHRFFLPFLDAYPDARGYIAPGLSKKRPDLHPHANLADNLSRWSPALQAYFIKGIPSLNETVWFHAQSGTLILTDLLFRFGRHHTGLKRLVARALGVYDRLAMSHTMKLLVKDRQALRRSVEPLLALPVQRVVLAHDQIVDRDALRALNEAFHWLLR